MDNNPIPLEDAIKLCKKYRDEHKVRLFSQCWGVLKILKGGINQNVFL